VIGWVKNNISVKDRLEFNVSRYGRTSVLTASFSGVEIVFPYHICPVLWKLKPHELACVDSSAYDAEKRVMRVTFVERDQKAAIDPNRSWEEHSTFVDPKLVNVNVAGIECLGDNRRYAEFARALAREVIASATARGPDCSARISKYDKANPGDPDFVLSVSGLRVIGPNSLDPKRWTTELSPEVSALLRSRFNVANSEHRTGIPLAALRAFVPRSESNKRKERPEDSPDEMPSSKVRRK